MKSERPRKNVGSRKVGTLHNTQTKIISRMAVGHSRQAGVGREEVQKGELLQKLVGARQNSIRVWCRVCVETKQKRSNYY